MLLEQMRPSREVLFGDLNKQDERRLECLPLQSQVRQISQKLLSSLKNTRAALLRISGQTSKKLTRNRANQKLRRLIKPSSKPQVKHSLLKLATSSPTKLNRLGFRVDSWVTPTNNDEKLRKQGKMPKKPRRKQSLNRPSKISIGCDSEQQRLREKKQKEKLKKSTTKISSRLIMIHWFV